MSETKPIKLTEKQIACLRHLITSGSSWSGVPNCSASTLGKLRQIGFANGGATQKWFVTSRGSDWLRRHDAGGK